jgi:SAM-dependent methyltransferase
VSHEARVSVGFEERRVMEPVSLPDLRESGTGSQQEPECEETTRHYLKLAAPEAEMISFRYVKPGLRNRAVLDLGCAKGTYLRQFGTNSLGIDISNPNLEHCIGLGLRVRSADLNRDLPIQSGSFEGILCSHALEHVDAPIRLLRECRRILAPGGTLVLGLPIETSVVNRLRGQRYFYHHPGHLYSFSLENIEVLLRKTGFDVSEYFFEPRILKGQAWLSLLQRIPPSLAYALALAYWVVAHKGTNGCGENHDGGAGPQ